MEENGQVVIFSTGARRSADAEDVRYDLIPMAGLEAVARTAAEGAAKYGVGNWLYGIPVSNLLSHAIRHLCEFIKGDTTEDHLGHAAWNVLAAIHMIKYRPDMNDVVYQQRPVSTPPSLPKQPEIGMRIDKVCDDTLFEVVTTFPPKNS